MLGGETRYVAHRTALACRAMAVAATSIVNVRTDIEILTCPALITEWCRKACDVRSHVGDRLRITETTNLRRVFHAHVPTHAVAIGDELANQNSGMLTGDHRYLAGHPTTTFGAVTRCANRIETLTRDRIRRTRTHGRNARLFFVARLRGTAERAREHLEQYGDYE